MWEMFFGFVDSPPLFAHFNILILCIYLYGVRKLNGNPTLYIIVKISIKKICCEISILNVACIPYKYKYVYTHIYVYKINQI